MFSLNSKNKLKTASIFAGWKWMNVGRAKNKNTSKKRKKKKICIAEMTSSCLRFQFHVCRISLFGVLAFPLGQAQPAVSTRACVFQSIFVPHESRNWMLCIVTDDKLLFRWISLFLSNFTLLRLRRTASDNYFLLNGLSHHRNLREVWVGNKEENIAADEHDEHWAVLSICIRFHFSRDKTISISFNFHFAIYSIRHSDSREHSTHDAAISQTKANHQCDSKRQWEAVY